MSDEMLIFKLDMLQDRKRGELSGIGFLLHATLWSLLDSLETLLLVEPLGALQPFYLQTE